MLHHKTIDLEIRHLGNTAIELIVECFNTAFADYIIPFHVEVEPMRRRWSSCRVDYNLSYGAFDGDQLVGFMITGVDQWQGKKTGYNSGTGVIPAYRGQGMVGRLYDAAIPEFRKQGISQCTLEVIVGNDRAIKSYRRVGFLKDRRLKCFAKKHDLDLPVSKDFAIRRAEAPDWSRYREIMEFEASWESQAAAYEALKADCAIWELFQNEDLVGFMILKPGTGHVLQFGVADRPNWKLAAQQIWRHAFGIHPGIRMNNVDSRAQKTLAILESVGMEPTVDQWEMKQMI